MIRAAALSTLHAALLLVPLAAAPALAAGQAVATVVVPKDSPSGQAAVLVGKAAREAFSDEARYDLLDLERFLMGGEVGEAGQRVAAGRAALERGRIALDTLELQPALESLAEAVVAFEQGAAALTDPRPLVDALLLEGAAYALNGDQKSARRSFERALVLDPDAELPPASLPPNVQSTFADVDVKMATGPKGTLTVYATPAAAEVWVDGAFRGSAPLVLEDVPAGRHVVRVHREGYRSFGTVAEVKKGLEASVQATLRPTQRFSAFDDLAARLPTGQNAAGDLAALLKVDRLFSAVVETQGTQAQVQGRLTDGVSGREIVAASKTFAVDDKLGDDVKQWIEKTFQGDAVASAAAPTTTTTTPPKESFLPGERKVETPPAVVWGWVMIGGAVATAIAGTAVGVYSLYAYDTFKNRVPNQLDPQVDDVRAAWGTTSVIADVLGGATVVLGAAGAALLFVGLNQKAELEDVLADRRPPYDGASFTAAALAARRSEEAADAHE